MIYTLGESLLDIIISSMDNTVVRPGGAMLNAAISLGRSGLEVSLISELGDDDTAKLIISFLNDNNVNTDFVKLYSKNNTSLALAFLDETKKPSYSFIKNYPNDRDLGNIPAFNANDILLFGSIYSLDVNIRKNILSIVNTAQKNNTTIIYDPNIRNAHHLTNPLLLKAVFQNIKSANIIKGSDEDFTNIFGKDNVEIQITELRKLNPDALIIITLGADGVIANYHNKTYKLPAIETKVVSTIGAGDATNAGMIYAISNIKDWNNENIPMDYVKRIIQSGLRFSSKVCASMDNYIPMINN